MVGFRRGLKRKKASAQLSESAFSENTRNEPSLVWTAVRAHTVRVWAEDELPKLNAHVAGLPTTGHELSTALIGQDWLRPIPCRIMAPYFEQLRWVEELSLFR